MQMKRYHRALHAADAYMCGLLGAQLCTRMSLERMMTRWLALDCKHRHQHQDFSGVNHQQLDGKHQHVGQHQFQQQHNSATHQHQLQDSGNHHHQQQHQGSGTCCSEFAAVSASQLKPAAYALDDVNPPDWWCAPDDLLRPDPFAIFLHQNRK